jgi:uncharacterized membrane protein
MRRPSIDLLRTIAILLMVLVHFVENLAGQQSRMWLPTGVAAPIFAFLAGFSHWLWRRGLEDQQVSLSEISRRSVRRGLSLIAIGFAFNVLVWMPEDTFNWDVLTFLGSSLLILELLHEQPRLVWLAVAVAAFLMAPVLRQLAHYDRFWTQGWFDPDWTLSDTALGWLATGYFPLFPWIVFPLAGASTADWLGESPPAESDRLKRLAWGGLGLAVAGLAARGWTSGWLESGLHSRLTAWTMFPPSPAYVIGMLGITLLLFAVSRWQLDPPAHWPVPPWMSRICRTFSQHSLSLYLLHHIAHLWPLWLYSALRGDQTTRLWQQATSTGLAVAWAGAFLVCAYGLLRWLDHVGGPTAESVLRWLCDSPTRTGSTQR